MTTKRRIGAEDSTTRAALLDAAQQLMLEEGYAAVTSRGLAAKAGLKPQLVHYYFRTMDDLFLAILRQGAEMSLEHHKRILASRGLRGLWAFSITMTGLIVEFTALANHRKAIRAEIAAYAERFRRLQVEALSSVLKGYGIDPEAFPPAAVIVLISAIARFLAMERALGVTGGHAETLALVERYLVQFEGAPPAKAIRGTGRRRKPSSDR